MSTDPFSDILQFTKAESFVTGSFTAGGRWAIRFPPPKTIKFFAVVTGSCWMLLDGEGEPRAFAAGDISLVAAPRGYTLASSPDVPPVDSVSLFSEAGRTSVVLGTGDEFSFIGGHVLLDPSSKQLLADVLPPIIQIDAAEPEAAAFRWLLDRLVAERASTLPGARLASDQLAQLLFIEILRSRLHTAPLLPAGWLRALGDKRLVPALRLMHADPARPWHLDELAAACAMSRTSFAVHFRAVVGSAPLTYLGQWRMHLAQRALREEATPVAAVGRSLGYSSESAFSTAFKRLTGRSPRSFRAEGVPAIASD